MSGTLKRLRDLREQVEKLGLEVLSFGHSPAGNRLLMEVKAKNGQRGKFRFGLMFDHHGDLNELSRIKRWHKNEQPPETAVQLAFKTAEFKKVAAVAPPSEPLPVPQAPTPQQEIHQIEEKPMPRKSSTRPLRILSQGQFYQLCEWLKSVDLTKHFSIAVLTKDAGKALALDISESTVESALTATGLKLSKPVGRPSGIGHNQRVLAEQVQVILKSLEIQPNEEFTALMLRLQGE